MKNDDLLTPEEALREYKGYLSITAQASWDRWPEANGMRRRCYDLGNKAGLSDATISADLKAAPFDGTGGRW